MYVYGVVSARTRPDRYGSVNGLEDRAVSVVSSGPVAALVSPIAGDRARGSRANLSAHQQVVEAARGAGAVLPVRFGTVMPDDETVVDELLAPHEAQLEAALRQMSGKSEFRIKATYLTDVAVREAVERDPSVRRLRRALGGGGGYHDRIELGERVAAAVARIKAADEQAITAPLDGLPVLLRNLDVLGADVAVHLAALVPDRERSRFEDAVDRLAGEQAQRLRFELTGPLAPWDFVDLHANGVDV